jgi:hypothetical protein
MSSRRLRRQFLDAAGEIGETGLICDKRRIVLRDKAPHIYESTLRA